MKTNKRWTIVTLIAIIISTAMISAVSTLCASFMELMRNTAIAELGNWHFMITDVPAQDVAALEHSGFDGQIALCRQAKFAQLERVANYNKPYLFILELGPGAELNFPVELTEGRLPENENEIALPEHLETHGGLRYRIGDTITLETGKRICPQGFVLEFTDSFRHASYQSEGETFIPETPRTYTVTGIFKRPTFEPSWSASYTAITFLDTQALGPKDTVSALFLARRANRGLFEEGKELAARIGLRERQVRFNTNLLRYSGIFAGDSTQAMVYTFAGVFMAIIIVSSVSVIYNAFAISVSERISQLGMLASVGATKRQKLNSVYFEGLALGVIGIPLGILSGIVGIGVTLRAIRPILNDVMQFAAPQGLALYVSPASVIVAAVLAAITIFISTWKPAREASRITPIEAIRQTQEIKLTPKTVRTSRLTRAVFGIEGDLALKSLKRSGKKHRATIVSLTVSLVLFLTASYYGQELRQGVGTVSIGLNADLWLTYNNISEEQATQLNDRIRAIEGVSEAVAIQAVEGYVVVEAGRLTSLARNYVGENTGGDGRAVLNASIYCLDDAGFEDYARNLGLDPQEFRDSPDPTAIVINFGRTQLGKRGTGEILAVEPGETLEISLDPYMRDSEQPAPVMELTVGCLTDRRPLGVIISPMNTVSIVVSREVFKGFPDTWKHLDSQGNPVSQYLYLTASDPDSAEIAVHELVKDADIGMDSGGAIHVFNMASHARREQGILLVMGVFIYGFISLVTLICIANILNTVTTNIRLRRREFAMLRSVGMTPRSFNRMIAFESIFYGLKALLWGLPISVLIAWLLYRSSQDVFAFGFALPWKSYVIAAIAVFVIVGATMLYSTMRVKKENIVDVLKRQFV
jgi:putative ABC transport system permease protein